MNLVVINKAKAKELKIKDVVINSKETDEEILKICRQFLSKMKKLRKLRIVVIQKQFKTNFCVKLFSRKKKAQKKMTCRLMKKL